MKFIASLLLLLTVGHVVVAEQEADFTLNAALSTIAVPGDDRLKVSLACDKCTYDKEHWHTFGLISAALVPQANIAGADEHLDGETSNGGPLT